MNKHTIGNLEARFSFTDRDGHQISGSYAKEDLASKLPIVCLFIKAYNR